MIRWPAVALLTAFLLAGVFTRRPQELGLSLASCAVAVVAASLIAGEAWLDPAVTGRVPTVYRDAPGARTAAGGGAGDPVLASLTAREREVLELIASG